MHLSTIEYDQGKTGEAVVHNGWSFLLVAQAGYKNSVVGVYRVVEGRRSRHPPKLYVCQQLGRQQSGAW